MIEFLSGLSILIGIVLQGAVKVILAIFIGLFIIFLIARVLGKSSCNGDCSQGRNCTCRNETKN